MRAIDTNIVIRYLTGDHPEQAARARALIDTGDVFLPVTVLLQAEWVLRSAYRFRSSRVCRALRGFCGLTGVTTENAAMIAIALDRAEQGMDFADALHLGAAAACDGLVTFDRAFVASANAAGIDTVREA